MKKKTKLKSAKATSTKAQIKSKSRVVKKVKSFLSAKKGKSKVKAKQEKLPAESLYINTSFDPAHSPGHRKMNLKDQLKKENASAQKTHPQNDSALNNMSPSVVIKRNSVHRKIITGATLGKTGQMAKK